MSAPTQPSSPNALARLDGTKTRVPDDARPARPASAQVIAFAHRGNDWIRGSEQCLLDLASRLDPARFRAILICEQPSLARAAEALGVPVVQLDPADDWSVSRKSTRARVRAQLRDVLQSHDVALVHANATAVIPPLLPVVRGLGLPLVAHLHLPVTDEYQRIHELVHQADVAVGVAEHVVAPLRADRVAAGRARVILNAVDTERLGRGDVGDLRGTLNIPTDAFVAVSIGSLIDRKGHDLTLRGIADARARGVDARLVICGDGDAASALRALAESLGIAPSVHFLGYRTDVGAVVRATADVFVTSAREEMLPLNVLEAQWLGVPVIASDIPAHREALAVGVTGVLVPAEDPAALGASLAALATDPARRAAFGAAGPDVVRARFGMEQYVRNFEALYAELLARPRSAYGWVRGVTWPPVYTEWLARGARRRLRLGPSTPEAAVTAAISD